jgi:hypothetical protein
MPQLNATLRPSSIIPIVAKISSVLVVHGSHIGHRQFAGKQLRLVTAATARFRTIIDHSIQVVKQNVEYPIAEQVDESGDPDDEERFFCLLTGFRRSAVHRAGRPGRVMQIWGDQAP